MWVGGGAQASRHILDPGGAGKVDPLLEGVGWA